MDIKGIEIKGIEYKNPYLYLKEKKEFERLELLLRSGHYDYAIQECRSILTYLVGEHQGK
jgi:hypothetical protein